MGRYSTIQGNMEKHGFSPIHLDLFSPSFFPSDHRSDNSRFEKDSSAVPGTT